MSQQLHDHLTIQNENGTYTIDVDKFREIIKSGGKMKRPMLVIFFGQ